jgi:multiple sugar transport system permease protein
MIRWDRGWRLALRVACALMVTIVFLFPVYWLAAISIKTPNEIYSYPPVWLPAQVKPGRSGIHS